MEESVDGCSKGWLEGKKMIKISKLLDFVTEYQPTANRHSGHFRKISTQQLHFTFLVPCIVILASSYVTFGHV